MVAGGGVVLGSGVVVLGGAVVLGGGVVVLGGEVVVLEGGAVPLEGVVGVVTGGGVLALTETPSARMLAKSVFLSVPSCETANRSGLFKEGANVIADTGTSVEPLPDAALAFALAIASVATAPKIRFVGSTGSG